MDMFQAVETCFKKYATFSGRASRSEYWFFSLFRFILGIVAGLFDKTVLQDYGYTYHIGTQVHQSGLLGILLGIVFFLPGFAVSFRRLHDTDRSGWWLSGIIIFSFLMGCIGGFLVFAFHMTGVLILLAAVVLILGFFLLYWFCSKGTAGDNRFGPDPLAVTA